VRARERARVERHAARALGLVSRMHLTIGWSCMPLQAAPGFVVYADAFLFEGKFGKEAHIAIDELRFSWFNADEREELVRHELAHIVAWERDGHDIQDHGPEFQRARREIDRALEEDE
jgi:hypothetical protein